MNSIIKSKDVIALFKYCLLTKEELNKGQPFKSAEGMVRNASFHKRRLEEKQTEIQELLQNLHSQIQEKGGGSGSATYAAFDKNDNRWTQNFFTIEKLLLLGIAVGKVDFVHVRSFWKNLPGGIPQIVIKQ